MFVRETRIKIKDELRVTISPCSEIRNNRAVKERISSPAQKNLNDKRAKEYFKLLVQLNFGAGDYHVALTYRDGMLPENEVAAEAEARKYIARLKYYAKKHKLKKELKYVIGSSIEVDPDTGEVARPHHHIIISTDIPRGVLEDLWRKPRKKGEREGEAIGYANADRLRIFTDKSLEELAAYIVGKRNIARPKCRRRWSSSLNLEKPVRVVNDNKYSLRMLRRLAQLRGDDRLYWEGKYPGYICKTARADYNDARGWSIHLVLEKSGRGC